MEIKMSEKEYRKYDIDSSSSLKEFVHNRKKYYKKYILKEKVIEEEDAAIKLGNLVDCLLLTPEEFDNKFHLSVLSSHPTGNMKKFVDELYKKTVFYTNEENILTKEFGEIALEAYEAVKYDKEGKVVAFKRTNVDSFESVIQQFYGGDLEEYYKELIASGLLGKTLVTTVDLENAERVCESLRLDEFVGQFINEATSDEVEYFAQFPVFLTFNGVELKGLIDRVEVNHKEKWWKIWDYKVTWNPEEFLHKYYLYRLSYLQLAIYTLGLRKVMQETYPEYEEKPMSFLVADSYGYARPLEYRTEERHLQDAINGFELSDKKYKGLLEITEDLKFHKESNIWDISRENYINKGVKLLY